MRCAFVLYPFTLACMRMRRARGNGLVFVRHVRGIFVLEILLCDGDCLFLGEIAGNRQHGVFAT